MVFLWLFVWSRNGPVSRNYNTEELARVQDQLAFPYVETQETYHWKQLSEHSEYPRSAVRMLRSALSWKHWYAPLSLEVNESCVRIGCEYQEIDEACRRTSART